ncbi:hypothetical protein DPM13_16360 [Paracoccus mutanolyticus]|uniref:Uncharacterized protein n=1 Tax=Paracoccus mutanolyticus TaxID=1499308 RepID=A0ABM6WTR1_9RHOB|nr:hypothetical protein [Paracoccus mutanolyticus]AWX93994.1 hypothetical protein DPM13_16360 [Paracoccus mutanolyticus]
MSHFAFAVDGDAFTIFGESPQDYEIILLRSKTHSARSAPVTRSALQGCCGRQQYRVPLQPEDAFLIR